ncbi:MAG: ABC transporter ATP-binding protein [Thermoplasmata archaeon]|nr:ABC transporter ATP-binding protein [Thermoplasmata archaeon]
MSAATNPAGLPPSPLALDEVGISLGGAAVLRSVSLDLRPGELLALVGPNGSGKTTLLRSALGLLPVASGRIRLLGDDPAQLSPRERSRRAAWLPQEERPSEDFSVGHFVAMGRYPHLGSYGQEGEADRRSVDRALEEAGLTALRDRGVLTLSGGERQRARYARALAQQAPLLFLDEPTTHLDIGFQIELMRQHSAFRSAAPGRAVVAALHDLNLACRFADRIAWLSHGRLVAIGSPGDTATAERVFQVFGVEATVDHRGKEVFVLPPKARAPPPSPGGGRRVHVVCGGGSGRTILAQLLEAGHRVSAGALNLLDSDQEFCQEANIPAAVGAPFSELTEQVRAENRRLSEEAEIVVVAPFAIGPGNLTNLEDLFGLPTKRDVLLVGGPPAPARDFCAGRGQSAYDRLKGEGARELPAGVGVLSVIDRRSGTPASPSADLPAAQ